MKKANVRSFLGNSDTKTAGYVAAHAQAKKRGRQPSEGYKHERNPRTALQLAQSELSGRRIFVGKIANSGTYSNARAYLLSSETQEQRYQRFATELRPGTMQDTLWRPDGSHASSIVIRKELAIVLYPHFERIPVFYVYNYLDYSRTITDTGYRVNKQPIFKFSKALRLAEKHFDAAIKSGKWVDCAKIRPAQKIEAEQMALRQPIENDWMTYPGHEDEYEVQRDDDGTYWQRCLNGWHVSGWWPEWNMSAGDGRKRWREVQVDGNGRAITRPPVTGEVVYEKPMVLRLIDLFAGKEICITHIDSDQKSSRGICKTAHAAPPGQREHFDIELENGSRYGFVPDLLDASSAEGGMGWVRGRRRFELVVDSSMDEDATEHTSAA